MVRVNNLQPSKKNILKNIKLPLWLIKIFNYEYWNWIVFYIPILPYWLYLAARTRSLTFFTNVDTFIEMGGFFGESKIDILEKIPPEYLPKAVFVQKNTKVSEILMKLKETQIPFPIVCKPDVGERGFHVEKVLDEANLVDYLTLNDTDFIIQEFIDFEIELGVLYYRFPDEPQGKISSITRKKFLSVTGDGKSTIDELMQQSTRARFQLESTRKRLGVGIEEILPKNKERLLEPIGNHCRGTMFLDNNFLINSNLDKIFDKISLPIEGFHYGRFDMKVKSVEDLYEGKNIRILELNGVSSEPGHIYDPNFSLWKAYRDLAKHWKVLADISIIQRKKGFEPIPFGILWGVVKEHFSNK